MFVLYITPTLANVELTDRTYTYYIEMSEITN